MTSAKKFKDLSSFRFISSRNEKSTITVFNAPANNPIDTREAATNHSDWILISSANNYLSPNRRSATALIESSSSLTKVSFKENSNSNSNSDLSFIFQYL